jgi:hypothetical protein
MRENYTRAIELLLVHEGGYARGCGLIKRAKEPRGFSFREALAARSAGARCELSRAL